MEKDKILHFAPKIFMDKKEPFPIKKVGYRIYEQNGASSRSFHRKFDFENFVGTQKVIEYAYYLDYDIQHLYDQEHIWIYLDDKDEMVGAEGSYHGRFLCAYGKDFPHALCDVGRLRIYSQPGKHAMLSDVRLMYLYSELFPACKRLAGVGGLDAPERYLKDIHITEQENQRVVEYIRENFSFEPSMEFVEQTIGEADYLPGRELDEWIPRFLQGELKRILG